jgi:hypothetical protein
MPAPFPKESLRDGAANYSAILIPDSKKELRALYGLVVDH